MFNPKFVKSDGSLREGAKITSLREIGKGGFGNVDLVSIELQGFKKNVARKSVHLKQGSHFEFNELNFLMCLRGAQFVTNLLAYNSTKDKLELFITYCSGGSLADRLVQFGPITNITLLLNYLQQLVLAVDEVHRRGLIHKDIKPGNVLLTEKGEVRLADFGLTEPINMNPNQRTRAGTTPFLPPEYFTHKEVTIATDYWSVGITSIMMATNNYPFLTKKDIISYKGNLMFPPMDVVPFVRQLLNPNAAQRVGTESWMGLGKFFNGFIPFFGNLLSLSHT